MDRDYLNQWQTVLQGRGVRFDRGLSSSELSAVEDTYGFLFPQDLKMLLQYALPVGDQFVNWRDTPEAELQKRLRWPFEGICFDIEYNGIWLPSWGTRPPSLREAIERIRRLVADAPTLIPIFSHRYIPAEPPLAGNPVLSVYQMDIIHYGHDLVSYFQNEFRVPQPDWAARSPRSIDFWDEIILWNNTPIADAQTPSSRGLRFSNRNPCS